MQITKPKISHKRLVISGPSIELYEYEYPYIWNTVGRPPSQSDGIPKPRREDNLSHTRALIRRLVDSNYLVYGYQPVFLTFTYEKNETSVERAQADFDRFVRRLNRAHATKYKYLSVLEFQERGAVHFHCIFFNMELAVELNEACGPWRCDAYKMGYCAHGDFRGVAILWTHGFVDIERVRSARRVGPYVCKYLNKATSDPRMIGKKAYTVSLGLKRPREIRDDVRIDRYLEASTLNIIHQVEYESEHYKTIKYTQYGN